MAFEIRNGKLHFEPSPKISIPEFMTFRAVPSINKVIFNPPATIVLWNDGTKTVVKCQNEAFDREKGLAMAVAKKALGNRSNFNNEFKKWIDKDDGTIRISAKVAKQMEDLLNEFEKKTNVGV